MGGILTMTVEYFRVSFLRFMVILYGFVVWVYGCGGGGKEVELPETKEEKLAQQRARERMFGKEGEEGEEVVEEKAVGMKGEGGGVGNGGAKGIEGKETEGLTWLVSMTEKDRKGGSKVFRRNGCQACHYKKKGMDLAPYPSKERLAQSYSNFTDCVLNGRPGTVMVAKNISEKDLRLMYSWLQKYR